MKNNSLVRYIFGDHQQVENIINMGALEPFNADVVDFLDVVSKTLLKDVRNRIYPDIATFAFWIRKASILSMKDKYNLKSRLGRGVSFHIAPSNVPINFAYSLVSALLAGNSCIVRLSSKEFPQTEIIANAFKKVFSDISKRIVLLQYGHNKDITDFLSSISDSRIIWGGNNTINIIRESKIKPRAIDLAFADRYSVAVIDAEAVIKEGEMDSLVRGFYNDTYLSDQNACTSPKIILWMGNNVKRAQSKFWSKVGLYVKDNYYLEPAKSVEKLLKFQILAGTKGNVKLTKEEGNMIYRIQLDKLDETMIDHFGTCGYFMEYETNDLKDFLPVFQNECQTVSYFGIEKNDILEMVLKHKPNGIDRIVPIGKTLDFDLEWDGYDLIYSLSRNISFN